jgi:hypothetical protein
MARLALLASIGAVIVCFVTSAAAADGGPSPGVSTGWNGVLSRNGQVRYVAVTTGPNTVVEAVAVLGGRVLRWTTIQGAFGIPAVAFDGSSGGLSHDGRTLVLSSFPTAPGSGSWTRFAFLKARNLQLKSTVALKGSFSFDALSPDASTLYVIQYTSAQDYTQYRVRAYDLVGRQLLPDAIVDRREPDEQMHGGPVTRLTTSDGRWAYTLYARQTDAPFIHALDTVERKAYCIDLPLEYELQRQMGMRLRLHGTGRIDVRSRYRTVAVVDLQKLEARKA